MCGLPGAGKTTFASELADRVGAIRLPADEWLDSPEESRVLGMRAALNAGVKLPPQLMNQLDAGGNPLIGAMQQLGLKLDARKAPVDVLIVDDVRLTPRENWPA